VPGIHQREGDPTATDDEEHGYRVGDEWQNVETRTFFKCACSNPGTAAWSVIMLAMIADGPYPVIEIRLEGGGEGEEGGR
jgi:hypothetical protein